MKARPSRRAQVMQNPAAVCLLAVATVLMVAGALAPRAQAGYYQMVLCAANNGSNHFDTATNTVSPQNPGGIFSIENYCGPAPFPAGGSAFIRIVENQPSGNAGNGAYASVSWTTTPWVAIRAAGGYTRQPNAFNPGWRARFWAEDFGGGGPHNILMQGQGVGNGGIFWNPTPVFASHLWPFPSYGAYRRFVYEMTCVSPSGCDRTNFNATDANTFILILSDESPSQVGFTGSTPLMSGQWVKGNQTATYNWTEHGSGIRFERLYVAGNKRFEIDHIAANQCNRASWGGVGEFARYFQPCPVASNIGRAHTFDTASLADGQHTMRVCTQDYGQWQGISGTGSESCAERTIRTDNTAPAAPSGLAVTSANPQRYLPTVGAIFSLPTNQGSPIAKVHYNVVNAAGQVVKPVQTLSATNPTSLSGIEGPQQAGEYRLRVWLEDQVGHVGPAATAPIPRDTTPPAAPQDVSVAAPSTDRAAEGFDVRWRNVVDAGSPIDAVHYQVLDGSGGVAVPVQTLAGENVQAIPSLDAPEERGNHTLRFWLSDAEGNVGAPVSVPLSYRCVRSRVGGGAGLTSGLGADGADNQVVREGSGSLFGGNLRAADGSGIAGAPLCVFARVVTDAQREFVGIAFSGRGGNYAFPVQAGASREISVVYRRGHRELSAQATLQVRVRPTFKLHRKVVRNKRFARFYGRIPGPHNDKVVIVLQVKQGKGWLAFRRYRTRDDGRFVLRYRFRRTHKRTRYLMRAQVRHTVGYPYLQGNSRSQRLTVLPSRKAKSGAKPRPRR